MVDKTKAPNFLNDDGTASMATAFMSSHHAFRRDIAQFARAPGRVAAGDPSRVGALRGHHTVEDTSIFPSTKAQHPELAAVIDGLFADHHKMDPMLEEGERAFAGLPTTVEAAAGIVSRLSALLDTHQATEETHNIPFLRDAKADIRVVIGDGRLKLAEAPDGSYDLFVLDAFSSDSVPVHLLTREAVELYLRKLSPHGVMAFHISNRYLDLRPVISGNARSLGLPGLSQSYVVTQAAARDGAASSIWILVARDIAALGKLAGDPRWKRLDTGPGQPVWTDEFSNILSVVRWFH